MEALILGLVINVLREYESMKVIRFDGDSMIVRDLRGLEWKVSVEQVISESMCKDKENLTFNEVTQEW